MSDYDDAYRVLDQQTGGMVELLRGSNDAQILGKIQALKEIAESVLVEHSVRKDLQEPDPFRAPELRYLDTEEMSQVSENFVTAMQEMLPYVETSPDNPVPVLNRKAFAAALVHIADVMGGFGVPLGESTYQSLKVAAYAGKAGPSK